MNIDRMLFELGVPDSLKGYAYIKTAMELTADDESLCKYGNFMALYESVGKQWGTDGLRVERCIRTVVDHSICFIRNEIQSGLFDTDKYYRFARNPFMKASTYLSALYMTIKEDKEDE